ncbi:hypothetical protein C2G38_2229059 [Gigaspora rosea]|uniref:Uncharacterized protein n=1 Tax=Gigaspora rosea TaxID=44941 RepID=A0A397U4P4_9GLOM|nr:hypothetical protein C2G38_2229059 [Gigaspora rosea]
MKKYWNIEPNEQPIATGICDIFAEWLNNEFILYKLAESDKNYGVKKYIYVYIFGNISSNHSNSRLSLNGPESWTNNNFLALKNILDLVYLMSVFPNICDNVDNMRTYHQILDRNLWNDIMKRAMVLSLMPSGR